MSYNNELSSNNNVDDIFKGVGVEVKLKNPEAFSIICETLTRIGIANNKDKKLYQTAHILHKRGRYCIVHFKEMLKLDGLETYFSGDEIPRRNLIAYLLEKWGLIEVIDKTQIEYKAKIRDIRILSHNEKKEWSLVPKYRIGAKKK